ncbi:MAG: glycosyltransferase family 1 protein [Candidatus Parcubacteria bacterium]|nr:glycosyltransferase family 1 protein [Candidatus Parcubacteria bacterium]
MYGKTQSGIGNYIKQITDHLFQLDKENDYFLFLLEPFFSQYQPIADNIHKIKVTSRWYSLSEQTVFLMDLLKYKLDLMHFPHFNAPIFYPGQRITTIHDIIPVFFPGHKQKSWLRKRAYQLTIKASLRKSAKIIAGSNFTKQELIKHFKVEPEKISVIYLGIENDFKVMTEYAKIKELKDKYKITKPFIFFISAWRNHKNFEGLIRAFDLIKKDGLDYQLVLAGQEDIHYPNIKSAINQASFKNDIITPGFIAEEELPLFYNTADLVVIPSFYEGFGLVGLEAMACGTPVIASNTASSPEILGQAALYFEPKDPKAIADTIVKVLTNPELQADLKQRGFQQIQKYSWSDCAQKTLEIYKQILKT